MKKSIFILTFFMILIITINSFADTICGTPLFQEAKQEFARTHKNYSVKPIISERDSIYIGYQTSFWKWDLTVMPPQWVQIPATCQGIGEYCYVFVEDEEWGATMTEEDVAIVIENFDESVPADSTQGIYEIDTANFGPPPDIDDDEHIYLFYSALGSYNGNVFDGYFSFYNELTEEEAQELGAHSNECEMLYISCNPVDPIAPSTLSVVSHEFEHMIHWNMDMDEELWVDEGCAEYAMFLYGYPDPIVEFPQNPDNNLIEWGQQFSDYVQTYLWMMYLHDHYGGADILTNIVAEQENCISGIEAALNEMGYTEDFQEIFHDWAIANYLDDTDIGDGKYGYYNVELPGFSHSQSHANFPVEANATVNNWATDYVRFYAHELSFMFNGDDDGYFGAQLLYFVDDSTWAVDQLPLDENQHGEAEVESELEYIIAAITNEDSEGNQNYAYVADDITDVDEIKINTSPKSVKLYQNYPNPFNPNTEIYIELPERQSVSLKIYDVYGNLVKTLVNEDMDAGYHTVHWNGRDESNNDVSSGVYLYKLESNEKTEAMQMILLR